MLLRRYSGMCGVLMVAAASVASAQYVIPWHTVAGGGAMSSTGGAFALGGTIAQPGAGPATAPMSGGAFELVGGIWTVTAICNCPGDLNSDGLKDARDIQQFVVCVTAGGTCSCADMDAAGGLTPGDVDVFVSELLTGGVCP